MAKISLKIKLKQVEKSIKPTQTATCLDEFLLKDCASWLEKLSFCYKNSAARHAHIGHLRRIRSCR